MTHPIHRRYSYPLQKTIHNHNKANSNKSLPIIPCRSSVNDTVQLSPVYPLTVDNLALHTKNYPPSKEARRINTCKFVESQRPVIEMERLLEEQREKELSLLQDICFDAPFPTEKQLPRKKWFKRFFRWIYSDSQESKQKKKRHLSWSAGAEKENHKVMDHRDSGISLFSTNRHTSLLSAIPIVRQPKFTPPQKSQHLNEFKAFPYPNVQRSVDHIKVAPPLPSPTMLDQPDRALII